MPHDAPPRTPDGLYIVVRGRLWRSANPNLPEKRRAELVRELMSARSAVRQAGADEKRFKDARRRAHIAKADFGERCPVWWTDGTADFNRYLVKNTPSRDWHESIADPTDKENHPDGDGRGRT